VCALAAPKDCEPFLGNQTATLNELRDSSYEEVFKRRLDKHVEALSRTSLLVRVDRLFALCQPPPEWVDPLHGFQFDREQLRAVDEKRHKIIHGDGVPLPDVDADINLLTKSATYLYNLIHHKYNLSTWWLPGSSWASRAYD
jgi:hypothetical protein